MASPGARVAVLVGSGLALWILGRTAGGQAVEKAALPPDSTPKQTWDRLRATLPPFSFRVERDEVVPSDSDPRQKLRRLEVKFYSQTIEGRAWGHPSVVYLPADRKIYDSAGRRGKVVIVGQRSWDGLATGPWREAFLGNYGEPIAARTGYPTMICPVPGEYDGSGGREISVGFLEDMRKRSQDPADHNYFRLAVPYLRALEVMAGILEVDPRDIRAVIGGHSKRATSAYTAASIDPERIVGVVYMGNESTWESLQEPPWRLLSPAFSRRWAKARVLYLGATNEDGYRMFNINRIQEMMGGEWTVEYIPNYRHADMSEHHFLDWVMWTSHVFEGRPLTRISDLSRGEVGDGFVWGGRPVEAGSVFRARVDSPNKIIQTKVWYVYNDDPPFWRDLVWYPEFMIPVGEGFWEGYVKGKLPDAWLVEVKDVALGAPGYVSSLPQDLTGLPAETKTSRGSRSRLWEPMKPPAALPPPLADYIRPVSFAPLGGQAPSSVLEELEPGLYRFRLAFDLDAPVRQDDWRVVVRPAFAPDFHWAPHLTPSAGLVVGQHALRSPALVAASKDRVLVLVPDLDLLLRRPAVGWYMDLDAPGNALVLGMSETRVEPGLFFARKPGAVYPPDRHEVGFFLFVSSSSEDIENPWRRPLAFLWKKWGGPLFEAGAPLSADLEPYVRRTYDWAFKSWAKSVWQEFEYRGKRLGAPVFIVNQTQSPNYSGPVNEREFRSVWNQAWFSSLRSASGLFRYARRTGDAGLEAKALLTKELALAAPVEDGLFPSVIATEMESVVIDGKPYNRSKGWATAFWGNSDRNPVSRPAGKPRLRDVRSAPYHLFDMSLTADWMLRWYQDLEPDARLLAYARPYAEKLLRLQDAGGYFPAWVDPKTLRPLGILDQSPESSASATFLLRLAKITGEPRYRSAALRALEAVGREIVPAGRWEDFETYWSSSSYGSGDLVGRKVARNNMHKQCNLSTFWTAEAFLDAWEATGERAYLDRGRRVLDELLMTQASWQPPYMYVPVLGGFGVMNADGEWLDARQSLFAEVILRYGLALGVDEYVQRGLAALRASFVMMYCPENPGVKALWEKTHPFFGPEDYGFTMENYAHGGATSPDGEGMGVFTIYDWGNGAAAEAWNRLLDRFGKEFLSRMK